MRKYFISRFLSFKYAFTGIGYVLKTQKNTWIYLVLTSLVALLMILLRLELVEISLLIIVICMVWAAEFMNTVIEVLVDLVSPNSSLPAKIIKDISAAAVLIMAIMAASVGIVIFIPNILEHYHIALNWSW